MHGDSSETSDALFLRSPSPERGTAVLCVHGAGGALHQHAGKLCSLSAGRNHFTQVRGTRRLGEVKGGGGGGVRLA